MCQKSPPRHQRIVSAPYSLISASAAANLVRRTCSDLGAGRAAATAPGPYDESILWSCVEGAPSCQAWTCSEQQVQHRLFSRGRLYNALKTMDNGEGVQTVTTQEDDAGRQQALRLLQEALKSQQLGPVLAELRALDRLGLGQVHTIIPQISDFKRTWFLSAEPGTRSPSWSRQLALL